jgi:hypothetical protein
MIPTVAQVMTRARALLDEADPGNIFLDAVLAPAYSESYDILWGELLKAEAPRVSNIALYTFPALTTVLTPATAGISDFGELVELEERASGSTDDYASLYEVDKLPQRVAADALREFVWRLDSFYFVGANAARQLRINYFASGTAPLTGSVGIDGSLVFLSNCTAAIAGKRKGYEEWQELWVRAVGSQYTAGIVGGELYNIMMPIVRSKQRTPLQPAPFTMTRLPRRAWRGINVAAVGGGDVPVSYTSASGLLVGTIDGVNVTFTIPVSARAVEVIVNGISLTPGVAYAHSANAIVFLAGYEPPTGSDIHVRAYL